MKPEAHGTRLCIKKADKTCHIPLKDGALKDSHLYGTEILSSATLVTPLSFNLLAEPDKPRRHNYGFQNLTKKMDYDKVDAAGNFALQAEGHKHKSNVHDFDK